MKSFLRNSLIGAAIACVLCGCNIQNTARNAASETDGGTPLSDFGGNVAYAASAEDESAEIELGSFSTEVDPKAKARLNNIKKASEAINQKVIAPGEIFSFNAAVGPTKKETGFKLARIFIKGKDAEGYGGGVCQVSSTLHKAAKEAGLTIVERHSHSKAVSYVPEGEDAATSYGYKDLRFKNDNPFPVYISSSVDNGKVLVRLTA